MEMETERDFMKCQQRLNEFLMEKSEPIDKQNDPLLLRHVFKFIHKNLNKLNDQIQMYDVLRVLHFSLRMELQLKSKIHVGSFVFVLINLNEDKGEETLEHCIQILYQMLKTLSIEDTKYLEIGDEIFLKLIEILLANRSNARNANILACLQLYINKFNATAIVRHLWDSIKDNINSQEIIENDNRAILQTLTYFFDDFQRQIKDFNKSIEFLKLIQRLIDSNNHEDRKSGYFILKKSYLYMEEEIVEKMQGLQSNELRPNVRRNNKFWNVCIKNFEILEENQFHLILPYLEQLKKLSISDLFEQIWLNILYRQALRHHNIMVRRWIIEYILETHTFSSLALETKKQFLLSLNETSLYNPEGYMLPSQNIVKFLACEKSSFLLEFSKIDWKFIPMNYWLRQLTSHWKNIDADDVSQEILVRWAKNIKATENWRVRRNNIDLFKEFFSKILNEMKLSNYVQLFEALHDVLDCYEDHKTFYEKLLLCVEQNFDGDLIFTMKFYRILKSYDRDNLMNIARVVKEKIAQLNWSPGSLRFCLVFHSDESCDEFCLYKYGINRSYIKCETPLKDIVESFCHKLAESDDERKLFEEEVTNYFIRSYIKNYNDLEKSNISVKVLLNSCSRDTLEILTKLLGEHRTFIGVGNYRCFVESCRKYDIEEHYYSQCVHLISYLNGLCDETHFPELLEILLRNNLQKYTWGYCFQRIIAFMSDDCLIEHATMGDCDTGDTRIENVYVCKLIRNDLVTDRISWINQIYNIPDANKRNRILQNLYGRLRSINEKRPKYCVNSKNHRSILGILRLVIEILRTKEDSENVSKLWDFLMDHQNQTNVEILYQFIIPKFTTWGEILAKAKEKLTVGTCTPSQEMSIIVLLYQSFMFNHKSKCAKDLKDLICLLYKLTMGAHSQTRLYSQVTINSLLEKCYMHESKKFLTIIDGIKKILIDEQFEEFSKDIRFMDISIDEVFNKVMQFTNAPFDEYDSQSYPSDEKLQIESELNNKIDCSYNVHKNLSPAMVFFSNLHSYPDYDDCMLFVVASLIDRIPDLGGIARTCEVLGIRNLVMETKAHTTEADFVNLSMTAERTLYIHEVKPSALTEFILQKKTEGFKIIGAEQNASSCDFTTFQFPKRSVLILGHEEEGIPLNLLGFLDYSVAIPQFGASGFMNVHATGALFMWEYCKQHYIKTS